MIPSGRTFSARKIASTTLVNEASSHVILRSCLHVLACMEDKELRKATESGFTSTSRVLANRKQANNDQSSPLGGGWAGCPVEGAPEGATSAGLARGVELPSLSLPPPVDALKPWSNWG